MKQDEDKIGNAEELWRAMRSAVSPFPDGVCDVREPIRGTAFFPGGFGLWSEEDRPKTDIPTGQIMIVGRDFNSVRIHEAALLSGTEVGSSVTWRNLLKILQAIGLLANRCFFTNLYMGLREGPPENREISGSERQRVCSAVSGLFH